MRVSHSFEAHPKDVGDARRFTRSAMVSSGLDYGDVPLMASELATNAVLHARSEFEVSLAVSPGRVRVEVSDANSRLPSVSPVPPDAHSGRGLQVVGSLASAWGVERTPGYGKMVWFEVPCALGGAGTCYWGGERPV